MGGEWGLTLERQLKMCKAALSRNKGPEKRAKEVVVDNLKEDTWNELGVRQADLVRPAWSYAWATVWMLRAAEAAKVLVKHVSIKHSPRHVTLFIPISKMDQKGKGVSRTLQCCGLPRLSQMVRMGTGTQNPGIAQDRQGGGCTVPTREWWKAEEEQYGQKLAEVPGHRDGRPQCEEVGRNGTRKVWDERHLHFLPGKMEILGSASLRGGSITIHSRAMLRTQRSERKVSRR